MRHIWAGFLVVLMVGLSSQGQASLLYSYSGNNFDLFQDGIDPVSPTYDTTNRVTGFFEVASPLAANLGLTDISGILLSFSFTDGITTRTNTDTAGADTGVDPSFLFRVSTDSLGGIETWSIQLSDSAFADLVFGEARHIVSTINVGAVRWSQKIGQGAKVYSTG